MRRAPSTRLRVIAAPFHDGRRGIDRGRGPTTLLDEHAILAGLDSSGAVEIELVEPIDERLPEAARVIEVGRLLAGRVRAAIGAGAFPLVLAGDCNSCLGAVAGIGADDLGVVWLDAHADFDTPEDTVSGSLDAMGLSILTGNSWQALCGSIDGFQSISEAEVVLVAVRDLEPHQRSRLERSHVHTLFGPGFDRRQLTATLDDLRRRVRRVYVHVDLDALDPSEGSANAYAASGGLTVDQLLAVVADVRSRFHVAAAAVTAYDPAVDTDKRIVESSRRIVAALAELAFEQP